MKSKDDKVNNEFGKNEVNFNNTKEVVPGVY